MTSALTGKGFISLTIEKGKEEPITRYEKWGIALEGRSLKIGGLRA